MLEKTIKIGFGNNNFDLGSEVIYNLTFEGLCSSLCDISHCSDAVIEFSNGFKFKLKVQKI